MALALRQHLIVTGVTFGVAALLLWGAWWLPLGRSVIDVVAPAKHHDSILLRPGEVLQQTYEASAGTQTGVHLYVLQEAMAGERLLVRILDEQQRELAQTSTWRRVSYLESDETVRLEYNLPWIAAAEEVNRIVEVSLLEEEFLPIRVSARNAYVGALTYNAVAQAGDMAFGVVMAAPLNDFARQGVVAGVCFLLGVLLISWLPQVWQWVAAGGLLVGITPLALLGFWLTRGFLGIADWDLYFSYHEIVRRTVLVWHQLPLWNTHLCGGTAALGDPEFPLFTLTFIPELLFGIPTGFPLAIYISVATTALGLLLLGKRLGMSVYAALLTAVIGAFSSVSILEIVEGHPNVFAAMWVPWVFWAWLAAYQQRQVKWYLITGVFLALMFYAGGIYLLMYVGLAFILLLVLAKSHLGALKTTVYAGLWALGLAAGKLLPVLLWLRQFPDDAYASSAFTLPWLGEILVGRNLHGSLLIFRQTHGWHEYGAYVGYGVIIFALLALVLGLSSRIVQSLALAAVAATLLATTGPALQPFFDLLPFLPRSNISRIILFAVLPLAILAGYGLDVLRGNFRTCRGNKWQMTLLLFSILVPGLVAIDLMSLTSSLSYQSFVLPYPARTIQAPDGPIAYTTERFDDEGSGGRNTRTYAATLAGYGTFAYCSVLGPDPSVRIISDEGDTGYVALYPSTAQVQLKSWSPNKVVMTVKAVEDTLVVLNTNFANGWEVNGRPAVIESNRPAAHLTAGEHRLVFAYRAPGFPSGFLITAGTLLFAIVSLIKSPHPRPLPEKGEGNHDQ